MRLSPRRTLLAGASGLVFLLYLGIDRLLQTQHAIILPAGAGSNQYPPDALALPTPNPDSIWPDPRFKWDDRILSQMAYVPEGYGPNSPIKTIYLADGDDVPAGQTKFQSDECPVDRCEIILDHHKATKADAVLLKSPYYGETNPPRPPSQVWIYYQLESPMHTSGVESLNHKINWTATYRADSTIVAPYEKFVPYQNISALRPLKDYMRGKSKMAAWFVSNCGASNHRQDYVAELKKHMQVDIYGACGDNQCPRSSEKECWKMLTTDYKFYLAFENSNCKYYITEKLFWNALLNDVVPVVLGGRKLDYVHAAPPKSFIFAGDFASAEELAKYLVHLSQDPVAYNSYLAWKTRGYFINTKFWCRVCALLHSPDTHARWYRNLEKWWRGNGTCNVRSWSDKTSYVRDWSQVW